MSTPQPKPATIAEYQAWLRNEHSIRLDEAKIAYSTVASFVRTTFIGSPFWKAVARELPEWDMTYRGGHNDYPLMRVGAPVEVVEKSFESFLSKTYRMNVVRNKNWPKPPTGGWLLPPDWIERVNDVVRTTLVGRYLDGVTVLIDHLEELAREQKIPARRYFQQTADGYYAAHLYVRPTFAVPSIDLKPRTIRVEVEIQVTTELQDVIKRLLHRHYEQRRENMGPVSVPWQWEYRSAEFATNYLGHILHYLEGMIMDVRARVEAA